MFRGEIDAVKPATPVNPDYSFYACCYHVGTLKNNQFDLMRYNFFGSSLLDKNPNNSIAQEAKP